MAQLNNTTDSGKNQINNIIIPVNDNHSHLDQEQESTSDQVAVAGLMLIQAREAEVNGDTARAIELLDMADDELSDVYARLSYVAGFLGGMS